MDECYVFHFVFLAQTAVDFDVSEFKQYECIHWKIGRSALVIDLSFYM